MKIMDRCCFITVYFFYPCRDVSYDHDGSSTCKCVWLVDVGNSYIHPRSQEKLEPIPADIGQESGQGANLSDDGCRHTTILIHRLQFCQQIN